MGGDICILIADSHFCTAETNTTLQSHYPPIKNLKKRPFANVDSEFAFCCLTTHGHKEKSEEPYLIMVNGK